MAKRKKPRLRFGPTTTPQGFTSYSTSSFSDLRAVRTVRALIQNSLDAAVEAGKATAIVRFKLTRIRANDVPDADGYKKAFRDAVRDQTRYYGTLPDAARQVADTIERALYALSEDEGHWCLSVLDNGIGLDAKRLNALLGDGLGFKDAAAAGSYGVDHFACVPASDLRYVLYGGVVESGARIASGYAVLASRRDRTAHHPHAAQGYLVDGFKGGPDGTYNFMKERSIPPIVDDHLAQVRTRWRHGSVVVIPAFNCFGADKDRFLLWNTVSRIVAYNFNAAIVHGRLLVEVEEDDAINDTGKAGVRRLDAATLGQVLESEKKNVRVARKRTFFEGLRPSGRSAYAAYKTLEMGQRHRVLTSAGAIDVRLLQPAPAGITRVDLCRNGMWITDDIVGLRRPDFGDRTPFHAVLLLNGSANSEFHRLVRKAEGPMHDELSFERLARLERETLERAFRGAAEWIRGEVPEVHRRRGRSPADVLASRRGGTAAPCRNLTQTEPAC